MSDAATHYRVLARKYRPQTFAELIGQEAMVRTLANAIASGRVAHAFILTGVRGVGKTTTARILARAPNCVGPDGTGGPTVARADVRAYRSIAEDRHVDVIEMDAASRTGVDDIRELTDGMRYRPVSARFKIYIIDEVAHAVENAFSSIGRAREPPPDVKFVFATTEIKKVPVTVLSRCQRFSLRRVPIEQLVAHYRKVAEAEGVPVEPGALGLIARAADGSVRDGLSILDQAIALAAGPVTEVAVRDMLGIADRNLVFDLFETVLQGDAAGRSAMEALYQGGRPLSVIQDFLSSRISSPASSCADAGGSDGGGNRERARPLAARCDAGVGARLADAAEGHQCRPLRARQAAEMVLVRPAYVADSGAGGRSRRPRHGTRGAGTLAANPPSSRSSPRPPAIAETDAGMVVDSRPAPSLPSGRAPTAATPRQQ